VRGVTLQASAASRIHVVVLARANPDGLPGIQARDGTQDASVRNAATMVVARSATGIGGPLASTWGGRSTQ